MSASIELPSPFPTDGLRPLSPKERMQRLDAKACVTGSNAPSCEGALFVGMFFDGTNNNLDSDRPLNGHSNIVRLFDAFDENPFEARFAYYIPGVGTPFPEIGELTSTSRGSGFGWGGEKRINWALLQVFNAVHAHLCDTVNLISEELAKITVNGIDQGLLTCESEMRFFEARLKRVIELRKPKKVKQLNISVFGFSRGAAEARAFCNWFFALCKNQGGGYTLADIPVRIQFLGIFDTVASVGLADTFSNSIIEGHMGWADDNMHINPAIEQCVHFVAAHEVRASFPLDSVRSGPTYPPNCKEVVYPGAHSDVGGGYKPGEQGKSPLGDKSELRFMSLIPAFDMHREATNAGVPLLPLDTKDTPEDIKRNFTPDEEMKKHFNAYLAKCKIGALPVEQALKGHMKEYFRYRHARLDSYADTAPHATAPKKERDALRLSNKDLMIRIDQLRERLSNSTDTSPLPRALMGRDQRYKPLTREEREILDQFTSTASADSDVCHFFDAYIHDSVAGFDLPEFSINGEGVARFRRVFVKDG